MPRVLLDAGHGGKDSGAVYNNRKESNDNLRLANRVKYHLENNNITVGMTRDDDETLDLDRRTAIERSGNYDYFISFHRNAYSPEIAKGVETYSLATTGKGRELSEKIQQKLKNYFYNRGCRTANYYVLKFTKCPAVLIETGFIDNTGDNNIFDRHFEEIAIDITKAILEQLKLSYKEPERPPISLEPIYRVTVNNVLKGSYRVHENILKMIEVSLTEGADEIIVRKVKN